MDIDPRQFEHVAVNDNDIHNIVMSYLVHNCFKETVESFIACTGMKQPSDYLEDMEKRKKIFQFALEGNALMAIELTEQLATNLLEKNKDLHFDLLSLHFVELVCSRKCTEALEFAQTKLAPFDKEQKYVEKLEDFMALLAYEEPEKSPMFHLLSLEYRQHVAESLNRAILGWASAIFFEGLPEKLNRGKFERISGQETIDSAADPAQKIHAFHSAWIMSSLVSLRLPSSSSCLTPRLPNDKLFFGPLLPVTTSPRHNWELTSPGNLRYCAIKSRLTKPKESPATNPTTLLREPHKYFDQVIITVRSGDGGHGAILSMPDQQRAATSQGRHENKEKAKKKPSYKRDFDGSLILPMGGHGGDVVIYADEGKDTLLEFHTKSRYNAKRGGNVDAMGVLTSQLRDGLAAPTLRVPVPVGTVVKRKRGKLLADLAQPGDEVLVARGGQGGISLLEMPAHRRKRLMSLTTNVMRDDSDKVLVLGQPGEEVSLELILRVVADVGLVGLPNAGKSTLLAAITLAKPDIADYPFTTLMPNLGQLDGDPALGAGRYSSEATLADLPGLIEGAHLGKGLGRNFLRHLRRTRLLVHVVDASAEDPLNDYRTVREELRMYNPNYLERPFVVVLNKIDLPEAREKLPFLTEEILKIGSDIVNSELGMSSEDLVQSSPAEGGEADIIYSVISDEDKIDRGIEDYPRPTAVVGASVLKGIRVNEMLKEIRAALRKCRDSNEALELSARS
ncbi:hypothetical protein QUC31_000267 [Theobroma cacao]